MFKQQFIYFQRCQFPKKNSKGLCSRPALNNLPFCKQHANIILQSQGLPKIPTRIRKKNKKFFQQQQQPIQQLFQQLFQQQLFQQQQPIQQQLFQQQQPIQRQAVQPVKMFKRKRKAKNVNDRPKVLWRETRQPKMGKKIMNSLKLCPKEPWKYYNSLSSDRQRYHYKEKLCENIINFDNSYNKEDLMSKSTTQLCGVLKTLIGKESMFTDNLKQLLFEETEEDES